MKIGYPCINNSLNCTSNQTFRLKSYSKKLLTQKVENNLDCLQKTLEWNKNHNLLFFRIGSGLVPFASHPINKFNWQKYFQAQLKKIGDYVQKNKIRISMHPDQFTVLNSPSKKVVQNSIRELEYHADFLDAMKLDSTAKIQIHVGGVYRDKPLAIRRFVQNYQKLPLKIKKRLVIENDDRSYSLEDCLKINKQNQIPILFDTFHHQCLNNGEELISAMKKAFQTWKKKDGIPLVDYSSQDKNKRLGAHTYHIDTKKFKKFIQQSTKLNFDIMLEIKDKEKSALSALKIIQSLNNK
jgi:UV DNA damage endonuclease